MPLRVHPNACLRTIDGRASVRRVQDTSCAPLGEASDDAGRALVGRPGAVPSDAAPRVFVVIPVGDERGHEPVDDHPSPSPVDGGAAAGSQ